MQFHPLYEDTSRRLEEALNSPKLFVFGRVNKWLEDGAMPEEILEICPRVAKQGFWRGSNLNYFDGFIADAIAARTKPMPKPTERRERAYERKGDPVYAPREELPADVRDKIDKGLADMMNRGINVMSVTRGKAMEMYQRGWLKYEAARNCGISHKELDGLTPAAAERFGL
jgi:hypothetical protein